MNKDTVFSGPFWSLLVLGVCLGRLVILGLPQARISTKALSSQPLCALGGLVLWSVASYAHLLSRASDSFLHLFSLQLLEDRQVFLSDHLVAIHLYGGLRKGLMPLVSLAIAASFDSRSPLSPLKTYGAAPSGTLGTRCIPKCVAVSPPPAPLPVPFFSHQALNILRSCGALVTPPFCLLCRRRSQPAWTKRKGPRKQWPENHL